MWRSTKRIWVDPKSSRISWHLSPWRARKRQKESMAMQIQMECASINPSARPSQWRESWRISGLMMGFATARIVARARRRWITVDSHCQGRQVRTTMTIVAMWKLLWLPWHSQWTVCRLWKTCRRNHRSECQGNQWLHTSMSNLQVRYTRFHLQLSAKGSCCLPPLEKDRISLVCT